MKTTIATEDYRVNGGEAVGLDRWPTAMKPLYKSKKQYHQRLEEMVEELSELQRLHYASNRYALLLIFQGMDGAGKDGAIRLWRTTRCLPERGRIGIFNRSYYEEVLVVRVHPEILRSQQLPDELPDGKTIWTDRYRSIVEFEEHLHRNGTRILKFFLRCRRTSRQGASATASMSRRRTGNSAPRTFGRGKAGRCTCRPMRIA